MINSDAERAAFNHWLDEQHESDKAANHKEAVARWLKDNPEIGALSSGRYYIFDKNDDFAYVEELEVLK